MATKEKKERTNTRKLCCRKDYRAMHLTTQSDNMHMACVVNTGNHQILALCGATPSRHHLRNVMHVGDETDYCWQCACVASFRFVARERIGTLKVNIDIYRSTSLSLLLQLYRSLCYLLRQYVVDTCVGQFYAKKPRSLFTQVLRLKPSVQDRRIRSELESLE